MKKRLAVLLAVSMLLLTACEQAPAEEKKKELPDQTSKSESIKPFAPTATMEETVLVDENAVKITATGIKYTAYAVKLELTIENNSAKNLSFVAGSLGYSCNSINGYMVTSGYLNADVAAGKKAVETVSFDVSELMMLGLTEIADIEIGFMITDDAYHDYLKTGPRQVKTSAADSYDYGQDTYREAITNQAIAKAVGFTVDYDTQEESFQQAGIRMVSQTLITNASDEQVLLVEAENTSSDPLYVSVGDVSINGLGVQSGLWSTHWISAGKRGIITLNLSSMLDQNSRETFGLEEIGTVAYSLEVKDSDLDALILPQKITLSIGRGTESYDASGQELYQEDDIRIVSKGLVPDASDYSDDIHLLLLVENNSAARLGFDIKNDSISVNGYMSDFISYIKWVEPGSSAVLDVSLNGLEENGISAPEDITEIELVVEVKNEAYRTITEPMVTFDPTLSAS